jgi:hypothetical protein
VGTDTQEAFEQPLAGSSLGFRKRTAATPGDADLVPSSTTFRSWELKSDCSDTGPVLPVLDEHRDGKAVAPRNQKNP